MLAQCFWNVKKIKVVLKSFNDFGISGSQGEWGQTEARRNTAGVESDRGLKLDLLSQ